MDGLFIDGDVGMYYMDALSTTENTFDNIIGTIEDIIVDEEFQVKHFKLNVY